jgi:1-acyl-sn-glycerol-3-phosphate acyltransferase
VIEEIVLYTRIALMLLLMTVGALVMLIAAIVTAFQARRFYRESIGVLLGKFALRLWGIRMNLHGALPDGSRQVVYVSNHTSTIDMFVLLAMALPNTRFFLSGFLRKLLPLGLIGYLMGIFWTVPQRFPEQRRQIFMNAERVLRHTGESVYLSPEGERVTTGEIGHFNKGAFHLATALHAPIVPMYIRIPPEIDPGKGLDARAGSVEVYIGEAVETTSWRVEDIECNRDRMRALFVDWHRRLRVEGGQREI